MDTVERITRNIEEDLWGSSVDITDAFLHVPMAWEFQRFFAFVLGKRVFVFQMMPFGLSPAPWAFTRIVRPIKAALHRVAVRVWSFLNDFLILTRSRLQSEKHTQLALSLLDKLAIKVNWEKSALRPQQRLEYLGVLWDFKDFTLTLPQSKVVSILQLCGSCLSRSSLSRRELESLVGLLNFAAPYLPLGRLYLLPLIVWMNSHTSADFRDLPVPLDVDFGVLLAPWTRRAFLSQSMTMRLPAPTVDIMTDASLDGWSGLLLPHRKEGSWGLESLGMSMNWMELKAIHLTILFFADHLRGRSVRVLSDNTTALACLRRQGSLASEHLLDLSGQILERCRSLRVCLAPVHIRGVLNVLADKGSRDTAISTEWSLDPRSFWWICDLWG